MKNTKYIFVTGGVVSSLGKGICASSIGRLLKERGLKVFMQKFDPYLNVDPGTMNPCQHGEVFVTDDGAETDLDLGHYERFIDVNLSKESNITSGKIYQNIISKERKGSFLGHTVQVIPHVTNEIKEKIKEAANLNDCDVIITEIGGTVGDIESLPFLEAIRQMRRDVGFSNTLYVHNTLVPYLNSSNEIKTKPTQHSVKELRSLGIQPDIIILRTQVHIEESQIEKIALFCDVLKENVIEAIDCDVLYEIPIKLHEQKIDDIILKHFNLNLPACNLDNWNNMLYNIKNLKENINIALVGKYVSLKDAYISVNEALMHAGYYYLTNVNIIRIDSEEINEENIEEKLKNVNGIVVPGGFGKRGIEGKILTIKYARENNIPLLGICYGMQLACIEYCQNVLGIKDANSTEINPDTLENVIDYLPNQYKNINLGGTLRLGLYSCTIIKNTKTYDLYKKENIKERHRHRYEFNNKYRYIFDNNLTISGINKESDLVEIIELKDHPYFICCQFHPEFLSRPYKPHPLFIGLIKSSLGRK